MAVGSYLQCVSYVRFKLAIGLQPAPEPAAASLLLAFIDEQQEAA